MKQNKKRTANLLRLCVLSVLVLILSISSVTSTVQEVQAASSSRWQRLKETYLARTNVNRLILVQYTGGSKAVLHMYRKVKNSNGSYHWKKLMKCNAYVGRNGIDKVCEGDGKTPTGRFWITEGFGINSNPGLKSLKYTKLQWYHYWSGEQATYNKMVDVRTLGRTSMSGEHLIDYAPAYNYALNIGYNKNSVFKKGSAIFLHCVSPGSTSTAGCVAVSQSNMISIMKSTTPKTVICIYPK